MNSLKWWQKAVFYQIYPRSFADGNNDGIGDFPGITSRLDYLCDLGIEAIWLSPHYPSPFLDCGYDISDYSGVGPEYGTLEDFKHFLTQAHNRNIRVILDLVLNHSSDQHPWFTESRSSLTNPKRDWYIWREGSKAGGPPNNWLSIFGGSAWELDPATGQYYYHAFLKEQPDLNWRNPQLKQAMWEVVRFWLDLGVDGFRLDAVATIFEDPGLPDHTYPVEGSAVVLANELTKIEYEQLMQYQTHQPGIHELLKELRALVDQYPGDRVLIGEDENVIYHGSGDDELHMVFNFPLMATQKLTPASIRANQAIRLADLPPGAWPCNTLGHHDAARLWSRYGDGGHDEALARLHLALLLTLKGTPFIYNGDEIGMTDLELTGPGQLRDTSAINLYRVMTEKLGVGADEAFKRVAIFTRDRSRSPFQWSSKQNSGFSPAGVQTWLPVNPDYARGVNVAAQENQPDSMLNFYRRLLKVRRTTPALVTGDYLALNLECEDYLAFLRYDSATPQTCLVLLNFSNHEQRAHLKIQGKELRVIFSSDTEKGKKAIPADEGLTLQPFEVFVALVC